jgi:hypothetical protein
LSFLVCSIAGIWSLYSSVGSTCMSMNFCILYSILSQNRCSPLS